MDLIKYERPKRQMKQFTITVETQMAGRTA